MRAEILTAWPEAWRDIWSHLSIEESAPPDLFCELYRELCVALKARPSIEALAEIIEDPARSSAEFERTAAKDLLGEYSVVRFLEAVHPILDDLAGDALANRYFLLLEAFVQKFNLRYELRRPCTLHPTISGVFASLMGDLHDLTTQDPHLDSLMKDLLNAVRDLRGDCADGRIRICIQKHVNLLEALGQSCPGVTGTELGPICDQVNSWPHPALKKSLKNLYGFASDYPGIRHAGNPASALRRIDMRDLIAVSILLAGFTPYLSHQCDAEAIFMRREEIAPDAQQVGTGEIEPTEGVAA